MVAGPGPLGAATAYHLARRGTPVVIVGRDRPGAAFLNSGGSICWHRPDPRKAAVIRETAEFVRDAIANGARIRCRDVPYLFLTEGVQVPALNIDSADLVSHLLTEAEEAGAQRLDVGDVQGVDASGGRTTLRCDGGDVSGSVVMLALGTANAGLVPGLDLLWEKRQLFVLDLPVDTDRARMPHTITAVGDGCAYVFVKEFDDGLRVVVGQEDIVDDDDPAGPVDHFEVLLDGGVADRFPFLRDAGVERILWGLDWSGKLPDVQEHQRGVLTVNCGSAVRACIAAGRAAADAAMAAMD